MDKNPHAHSNSNEDGSTYNDFQSSHLNLLNHIHHPEKKLGRKEQFVRSYYGYIAVTAGILNGLQVFLFEVMVYTQIETSGISLYYSEFFGFFLFFTLYYLKDCYQNKQSTGHYFSLDRLSFLKIDDSTSLLNNRDHRIESFDAENRKYKFNKFNIIGVFTVAVISVA